MDRPGCGESSRIAELSWASALAQRGRTFLIVRLTSWISRVPTSAENISRARVDEVVSFVHEKAIITRRLGKMTSEIDIRIEQIVVVTDDSIDPEGEIEGKFERTDLMFSGERFEERAVDPLALQSIAHGRQSAIVVADGKRNRSARHTGAPSWTQSFSLGK